MKSVEIYESEKVVTSENGTLIFRGNILNEQEIQMYFDVLLSTLDWQSDRLNIFGKLIITKRKVAWYGSHNFDYTYSGQTRTALPWTPELLLIKQLVELVTNKKFNACLLNLYHNGGEGMSWHTDDEKEIEVNSSIACLSLGAERFFDIKHLNKGLSHRVLLTNGSLIEMQAPFQEFWKHQIPIQKKVKVPRISLTFRLMKKNK